MRQSGRCERRSGRNAMVGLLLAGGMVAMTPHLEAAFAYVPEPNPVPEPGALVLLITATAPLLPRRSRTGR